MDRLDQVLQVRDRAAQELGATFHVRSDACYGGYAAALTRNDEGRHRRENEIRGSLGQESDDSWVRAITSGQSVVFGVP